MSILLKCLFPGFFACSLLVFTINGYSQDHVSRVATDQSLDQLIEKLDSTAAANVADSYPFPSEDFNQSFSSLFTVKDDSTDQYAGQLAVLQAEKKVLQGDYGLDLEASYLENFKAGLFDFEGIFYKRRARFGLEWNILKNGLIDNKYEIDELNKQIKSTSGIDEQIVSDQYLQRLQSRIKYTFNRTRTNVLKSYLNLLNQQEEISIALYHQKYVNWDAILALTSEKARIDRLLQSNQELISTFIPQTSKNISIANLPVFNVNLGMLLEAFKKQQNLAHFDSGNQVAEYHPLTDISLSASLQYNFYSNAPEEQLSGTTGRREFVSAGLNLSVPLPLQIKDKNDLVEAKRRQAQTKSLKKQKDYNSKVYKIYDEYQRLLSEYERDIESYKMYNEQIRIQLTKRKLDDPEYSPRDLLEVLEDRFSISIELINNHEDMYLKIWEMFSFTYQSPVQQYLSPMAFNVQDAPQNRIQASIKPQYTKSIYLWSQSFRKYSNKAIIDYINGQQFDTVFLSGGPQPNLPKVRSFIKQAHKVGISVEWMVGNNQLLFPDNLQSIIQEITLALNLNADGLHLDVEPQTFDDWEEKEKHYKNLYLKMAQNVYTEAQERNLSLSLSIPVYFDTILPELKKYANSLQLMAYGTDDIETLQERINHELQAASNKVALALRPEDFSEYEAFSSLIKKMQVEGSIQRFSIHDFEALLQSRGSTLNAME